jgi:isopentenyldiphosphate isomerase
MEIFPLVDAEGNVIGKADRATCHSGSLLLHPVVHLHVFNSRGELFLQKRPMHKDIQPGKWDTSVGGHIDYGETVEVALEREVREELGITDYKSQFLWKYVFESTIERELVYAYSTTFDGELHPDPHELEEGRFWSIDEIKSQIGKSVFTTNFEGEFMKLSELLNL